MHQNFPAIHKPSAAILIDDDHYYSEGISLRLPKSANANALHLSELKSICTSPLLGCSNNVENDSVEIKPISLSEIMSSTKHDIIPISVIVLDHYLTPHNGLDIFRKIHSPFIQKILISNFLSNQEALDALNKKEIHAYFWKMDELFVQKLAKAIEEAQQRYFWHLSLTMQNFFTGENLFSDPEIAELFRKIKVDYQVKYHESSSDFRYFEFYDEYGKNKAVMSIFPEEEIDELINSFNAETASPEILSLVKSGAMLPFTGEHTFPEGKDWPQHLKSAHSFQAKNKKYLYAVQKRENHG